MHDGFCTHEKTDWEYSTPKLLLQRFKTIANQTKPRDNFQNKVYYCRNTMHLVHDIATVLYFEN